MLCDWQTVPPEIERHQRGENSSQKIETPCDEKSVDVHSIPRGSWEALPGHSLSGGADVFAGLLATEWQPLARRPVFATMDLKASLSFDSHLCTCEHGCEYLTLQVNHAFLLGINVFISMIHNLRLNDLSDDKTGPHYTRTLYCPASLSERAHTRSD